MRYFEVYVTAPRAFSKSFLVILAEFLQCVFLPGTKRFICAPAKRQGAQIAKEKLTEIFDKWPLLRREVIGGDVSERPGRYDTDNVCLRFRNGSVFDVVGSLDTSRGGRRHGGLIDEVRDQKEDEINNIVLPLMNVSRRLPSGEVNIAEPNHQKIFMTSAGSRLSFAYDVLIDSFQKSIMFPKSSFVFGCNYRVPLMHGLLDYSYLQDLKSSTAYNDSTFAKEYLSNWDGEDDSSWFKFDRLEKYRKLKIAENHSKFNASNGKFYLLSVKEKFAA